MSANKEIKKLSEWDGQDLSVVKKYLETHKNINKSDIPEEFRLPEDIGSHFKNYILMDKAGNCISSDGDVTEDVVLRWEVRQKDNIAEYVYKLYPDVAYVSRMPFRTAVLKDRTFAYLLIHEKYFVIIKGKDSKSLPMDSSKCLISLLKSDKIMFTDHEVDNLQSAIDEVIFEIGFLNSAPEDFEYDML